MEVTGLVLYVSRSWRESWGIFPPPGSLIISSGLTSILLIHRIVSDPNLSRVVRSGLHCYLAAIIFSKSQMTKLDPYACNWLERLRHIKRFKGKVLKEEEETSGQIHDFTGIIWFKCWRSMLLHCDLEGWGSGIFFNEALWRAKNHPT